MFMKTVHYLMSCVQSQSNLVVFSPCFLFVPFIIIFESHNFFHNDQEWSPDMVRVGALTVRAGIFGTMYS